LHQCSFERIKNIRFHFWAEHSLRLENRKEFPALVLKKPNSDFLHRSMSENPTTQAEQSSVWYKMANEESSVEVIEANLDKLDWEVLSANESIPVSFFENHLDDVDWSALSGNSSIPMCFFEAHLDRVDWSVLSGNWSVPLSFIEAHLDKIDWHSVLCNRSITVAFVEAHLDKIDLYELSGNTVSIPESFFEQPHIRERLELSKAKALLTPGIENIAKEHAEFALDRLDTRDREAIYCGLFPSDGEFNSLRMMFDREFSLEAGDKLIRNTYEFVANNLPELEKTFYNPMFDRASLRQTIGQILVLSYVKLKCTNEISELTKILGNGRSGTVDEIPKFVERNFIRWLLEGGSVAPSS
jgi:hypothetical protein